MTTAALTPPVPTGTPASASPCAPGTLPVLVNGLPQTVPAGTSLADWLHAQHPPVQAVATAVNGMFVARERRAQQVLQPGYSVTTFQPIVGG